MLNRWIKHLNAAIDNMDKTEDFCAGEVRAYIDTICDLADYLGVRTEINPMSGHCYIVK